MGKRYTVSDFSRPDALTLIAGGVTYQVASFAMSFAVNEIPQAQCLLAVGRRARSQNAAEPSAVHTHPEPTIRVPASVVFHPAGEHDRSGKQWPAAPITIFSGYLTGFAPRKTQGKVYVSAGLTHWLSDLADGSALSETLHVANPTKLNSRAVYASIPGAISTLPNFVTSMVGEELTAPMVHSDTWKAIKTLLCALTELRAMRIGHCEPDFSEISVNAREALKKIEGPGGNCSRDYKYGVPLKFDSDLPASVQADSAIAAYLGYTTVESFANTTLWDKLVNRFCPDLGLAVVPGVDRALVIADLPAYTGQVWRTLEAEDIDSLDTSSILERPLSGVAVMATFANQVMASQGAQKDFLPVGACYLPPGVARTDGTFRYVEAPFWLQSFLERNEMTGSVNGWPKNDPHRAVGADTVGPQPLTPTPSIISQEAQDFFERYAKDVYTRHALRGRSGSASGRLRFDIAPGSIVRIKSNSELFLGRTDYLATEYYASVERVTISINAEETVAGTAFKLSHVRNPREYAEGAGGSYGSLTHPLFGDSIHGAGRCGMPLVEELDL